MLQAKAGLENMPGEDREELLAKAKNFSFEELEKCIRLLGRCMEEMRRSSHPAAVFQVFCLRMAGPGADVASLARRIEALEKALSGAGPRPVVTVSAAAPVPPAPPP